MPFFAASCAHRTRRSSGSTLNERHCCSHFDVVLLFENIVLACVHPSKLSKWESLVYIKDSDVDEVTMSALQSEFQKLYDQHGIKVFTWTWLSNERLWTLYDRARHEAVSTTHVASALGLAKELEVFKAKYSNAAWTPEDLDEAAADLIRDHGCIPSTTWLEHNGLSGMYNCIVKSGGIAKFREKYHDTSLNRRQSRDGQYWDSQAEVCCVDFLWGRGLDITKGKLYPATYAVQSGKAYGRYDIHFSLHDLEYDIEIWGADRRSAREGTRYADTKRAKQLFNKDNKCFIGIGYEQCYKDTTLEKVFEPYIGILPIIRYARELDKQFTPAAWSLADDVLKKCKFICEHMEDKCLPCDGWFKKNGKYKDRTIANWETDLTYSLATLADQMIRIGGFIKIRVLLGQNDNNRRQPGFTKSTTLQNLKKFYNDHESSPSAVRARLEKLMKKRELTTDEKVLKSLSNKLHSATLKHFKSTKDAHDQIHQMEDTFDSRILLKVS